MSEPVKNHRLAFFYALVSSTFFGIANYNQALLASRVGPVESMMVQAPHFIAAWLMYHLYEMRKRPFFDKDDSEYFSQQKFQSKRLTVPLLRAVILLAYVVIESAGYYCADQVGVNSGVLTALQGVSIVINIIIFRYVYDQKLSCADAIGVLMIMVSIIGISAGGAMDIHPESETHQLQDKQDRIWYFTMATVLTLVAGIILGFRPLSIQYSMDIGFHQTQSHFDSMLMLGIFWLPKYIKYYAFETEFNWDDFVLATIILFCVNGSLVSFGIGLQYGNSGILMALENTKPIPQILLAMCIDKIYPNWIQVVFIFVGILSAIFIIVMRTKANTVEPMTQKQKGSESLIDKMEEGSETM